MFLSLLFSDIIFEKGIHLEYSVLCCGMQRKLAEVCLIYDFKLYVQFADGFAVFCQYLLQNTHSVLELSYRFSRSIPRIMRICLHRLGIQTVTLKQPKKRYITIWEQNGHVVSNNFAEMNVPQSKLQWGFTNLIRI